VEARITGPDGAPHGIEEIATSGKGLVLRYTFDYEGTPVDAAVQLIPATAGKMQAEIAFAGGAYVMSGGAERKGGSK